MKKRQHTGLWVLACCPLSIRVLTYEVFIENVGREKRNRTALQYITAIPYPRYSPPHEEGAYLQDDYAKSFVDVWGRFSVGDYTNKNGDKIPTMTIFATKVAKRVRNN